MNKSLFIIGLLLFLLIPVALSVEVENVSFSIGSHELNYISPEQSRYTTVGISLLTNETLESFIADFSDLTNNPVNKLTYANYDLFSNCVMLKDNQTNLTTGYYCTADNIEVNMAGSTANLVFDITTSTNSTEINYTQTFQLDTTKPKVTSITTEYSYEDNYYIASLKPTQLTINLEDSVGSFDLQNVWFVTRGGFRKRVYNCSGMVCTGLALSACQSQSTVKTVIGYPSTDDAGNSIEGEPNAYFICDEQTPGVLDAPEFHLTSLTNRLLTRDGQRIETPMVAGDKIEFSVILSEDSPGMTAYANFSELTGQAELQTTTCQPLPGGTHYNCTWIVQNILEGEKTVDVDFVDIVGRRYSASHSFTVNAYVDNSSLMPTFFGPSLAKINAPLGYNRIALDLASKESLDYPIFATYTLNKIGGGPVDVLFSDLTQYDCSIDSDDPNFNSSISAATPFDISLENPLAGLTDTNRLNIIFKDDPNIFPDTFNIVCNLSVNLRSGNTFYKEPASVPLIIPMKFRNSRLGGKTPGIAFADKIIQKQESMQGFWKWIGYTNTFMATLTDMCSLEGSLSDLGFKGTAMKTLGMGMMSANLPGGQQTAAAANGLLSVTQLFVSDTRTGVGGGENKVLSSKVNNFVSRACELARCNVKDKAEKLSEEGNKNALQKFYFNGNTPVSEALGGENIQTSKSYLNDVVSNIFEDSNLPNPKESIIAAIMTECYPAVLYHLNKYRQMDCKVLTCMKTQSRYGLDISSCEAMESQYICNAVVSEVMEFPVVRQAKNIVENTGTYTKLFVPNIFASFMKNTVCKNAYKNIPDKSLKKKPSLKDWAKLTACDIPRAIGDQLNHAQKDSLASESFTYPIEDDACVVALCNKPNIAECGPSSSSLISSITNNYLGIHMPKDVQHYNRTSTRHEDDTFDFKELFADKITKLTNANTLNNQKMDHLKSQLDEMNDYLVTCNDPVNNKDLCYYKDIAFDNMDDLEVSIGETETDINKLQKEIDKNSKDIKEMSDPKTRTDIDNALKDLQEDPDLINGLSELNACKDDDYKCRAKVYAKHPALKDDEQLLKNYGSAINKYEQHQRAQQMQNKISAVTDQAAAYAVQQGWFDFMQLNGDWLKYTDSDNWKNQICSPLVSINAGHLAESGTAIQCNDGICNPVLTQAAEKTKFNDTHYMYTVVYYVGNVKNPNTNSYITKNNSLADSNVIKYTVEMKTIAGLDLPLFTDDWQRVPYGFYHDYAKSFVSTNNFDKICFVFEKKYPPQEIGNKREYCRDIVDATNGRSDFDTGRPALPSEYSAGSEDVETGGSNQGEGFTFNNGI